MHPSPINPSVARDANRSVFLSDPEFFLRLPQVLARVGFSRSTLWRRVRDGSFPSPIKLSARVTVWRQRDIDDWMRMQG